MKLSRGGANPCLSWGEWRIDNPYAEVESSALWSGTDGSPLPSEVHQFLESVIEQLGQIREVEKERAESLSTAGIVMSRQMLFPELDLEPVLCLLPQSNHNDFS